MANPRRNSYSNPNPTLGISSSYENEQEEGRGRWRWRWCFGSVILFLKRPHSLPILLSILLLLTWVSLRLQQHLHHSSSSRPDNKDDDTRMVANIVRFSSSSSQISRDKRGWLLNPVAAARDARLSGGAVTCASVHVGQIRPGAVRGNHRHHTCNETFIIWGARTKFRLENPLAEKGFTEVTIGAEEVAVASSPSGTAHALVNVDPVRTTLFLGCQDNVITYNSSSTDFNVWKDL